MASRLALKYGLVAEEDRLSSSSDALLVTEPTTGSKARTKGSLYLITTARSASGKTRDACRLVADQIRREYYYDESAGIAIVLGKAVRAANKRLRHAREGSGLAQGAIGIAVAIVRGNELYVATCGDADAYLIRSARLLMPEHESGGGLPAADSLHVDVWRGEFSVGDSLVLCSRNLVEVVGTEELKNALVTLHPQSAVEHLHHLFVAAGGEGSDAVLAMEATEVSLTKVEHRLVPVSPAEPLAGAPTNSPIPLADQFAGAATAVQERAGAARSAVSEGFSGVLGRVLDLPPRRRTSYRRITTTTSKRETQRRAAIAALAFIGLVAALGIGLWYWQPLRNENPIDRVTEGENALAAAVDKANSVFGPDDLLHKDPDAAREALQGAWADLAIAREARVDPPTIAQLDAQIRPGLDQLYLTYTVTGTQLYAAPAGVEITDLTRGPDEAAYAIAGAAVIRVDPTTGNVATIVQPGAGAGQGIGTPRLLARGGPDLLILDEAGALWRWRPSDSEGGGTLGPIRVAGEQVWDESVVDFETFVINSDLGFYRIYVPYPQTSQVLRYDPTADGSGFSAPAPYFVSESVNVATFRQLYIDGDVYAVETDNLEHYFNGRATGFSLDPPPDAEDLRPGHDYALLGATGTRSSGDLFVWDRLWSRLLIYDKAEGAYAEQYLAASGAPQLADIRGMYIVDQGEVEPPILVWALPDGIYQAILEPTEEPTPSTSPTPGASASPRPTNQATAEPSASPSEDPTPSPTIRPRRTPRITEAPSP
ncbi:MAG: hypothetical protein ABI797_05345 [Chloroflexota bacterium]